jgi:valyl-tRNA synthetase
MSSEELYKEIAEFTNENKKNINSQIKKMGASCDWSREKFTLDKDIVKIVYNTFEKHNTCSSPPLKDSLVS